MRVVREPAQRSGFSLVELLIVLALLIILTTMGTSRFSASARRRELTDCQKNLQKIYLALTIYRSDNNAYPFAADAQTSEVPLSGLIPKCTTDTSVFICPGSGDAALPEGEGFAQRRISYAYYMGRAPADDPSEIIMTDWQVNNLPKTRGQIVFSPNGKKPGNNHRAEGGNLLSCGGDISQSGPKASRDLVFPATVRLLNP